MTLKKLLVLGCAGGMMALPGLAQADECGSVSMAEWNWASGELMANVDKIILEEGYGCDVELVPGATQTTFASMNEKGEPGVAGELWINAVREPLEVAFSEGRLHSTVDGPITDLGEGWWVTPKFVADHPDLDTVEKILERPDLFPYAEDPSKGAFVGCPAGWGCQLVNANLFRAFEMEDKGWVLVDPGSAAGLDGSMTKAVERDEYWFGYYWSPTAMIGKHNMQLIPFEVEFAGKDNWDGCLVKPEQECADPKPSAWTKSEVHTVITDKFMNEGGPAIDYLKKRIFPGEVMNGMLVYMQDNQAGGEDAAFEFLLNHEEVWSEWVPADVAEKVKAAL
ncbi:glycine betaine ABC transporter substrate-binding protein [Oceanomicrobium pacificus]|uniref:ABC transporter substrate-binding protein n=1 Tax=Oceanomicrobium pacificus TaxID=2692916 RepID=A0A6B0TVV5_9RHOB|nr:glycine betaine ABC transporter substrate-binding protein [Oceanomicrobium pacificus]MXU65123.1 ABC transporter substrate-binding protein [Oceanomicrobium pacificus]